MAKSKKNEEQIPVLPTYQEVYYLKVRHVNGQWRTVRSDTSEEHEAQKIGFIKFGWEIREEYVKKVPIFYQLKLEL